MRKFLSERNLAAFLFVLVMVVFSMAQSETKKMEALHPDITINVQPSSPVSIAAQPAGIPVSIHAAVSRLTAETR